MAQDFESTFAHAIKSGSFTTLLTSNSDDAVVGIRFANLHSGSVSVDTKITRSSQDFHLIKNAPIPEGGSLELIDGGSKIVLMNGDALKAQASKTGSIDAVVSFIDTISE